MKPLAKTMGALALVCLAAMPAAAAAVPAPVQDALAAALQDERHAEAFYAAVMARHGAVRPFRNIIRAEQRHQAMLEQVMASMGVAVPPNPYDTGALAKPEAPATLAAACQAGVQAEIANRDLYDGKLLPAVKDYPAVTRVFTALAAASEQNHLPAFRRCGGR